MSLFEQSYQVYNDLTLFPLKEPYEFGKEKIVEIASKIEGRSIIDPHNAGILAQAVANAKHGDHIEIGTLFGASAILVACTKKEFGSGGTVYTIDPLEYGKLTFTDKLTGLMATTDIVMENASKLDVEDKIEIITEKSYPFPLPEDKTFASGYIDGDHWNGMPMKDWLNLKKRVTYTIIFDDYCTGKTEVIDTVNFAMQDRDWLLVQLTGLTAVFRRRH
jgi:hypothetical protein